MNRQMMRLIASPSSSTMGLATLILFMPVPPDRSFEGGPDHRGEACPEASGAEGASAQVAVQLSGSEPLGFAGNDRLRLAADRFEDILHPFDNGNQRQRAPIGKTVVDGVMDHLDQRIPVAVEIDQDQWFVVQPNLPPGENLESFIKRAHPAGQNREGVGQLEHPLLANMHAVDDMQLAGAAMTDLTHIEVMRDDSDHASAFGQHGIGHNTHQPDPTAAIDQGYASLGQDRAELTSRLLVPGIEADRRTAINAKSRQVRQSHL